MLVSIPLNELQYVKVRLWSKDLYIQSKDTQRFCVIIHKQPNS